MSERDQEGSWVPDNGRGELSLIAYRTNPSYAQQMPIVPASSSRVDERDHPQVRHRCLPLKIASQAGWFVLNNRSFHATWDGSAAIRSSVEIVPLDEGDDHIMADNQFGHGILTFSIPYLFRTPPGYNLLVRGPANWPKDGVSPLEGVVETDWTVASFTMNWKLTRPNHPVLFEEGEPICMIVPQKRGELESFGPEVRPLEADLELAYDYWKWAESRWSFLADGSRREASGEPRRKGDSWQKHYVRGTSPTGVFSEEHQTKLRLGRFE